MAIACGVGGRPNAGDDGAGCGADTAAMPDHRGGEGETVLPEGVLPQRLHQEPEATGALLQYARLPNDPGGGELCVPCYVGALPAGNSGKGDLLAATRGPEQPRHDDRCPRLYGYGGEPNPSLPANAYRRLQPDP